MEKILNKKDFRNHFYVNKYKAKSHSKESKELDINLNYSLHNHIKKISHNKKFNKLKKQKTLDKFFEKYFSEKSNIIKDKIKKSNASGKNLGVDKFYNSSDKSVFYKKTRAKITKILKNKKIVDDLSFKYKNNFSEYLRSHRDTKKHNSPSEGINTYLDKNIIDKRSPQKTINTSDLKLKLLEDNQDNNCTFLNQTNTNFFNSKNNFKINNIKSLNNNLEFKKSYPMIWQIIAFSKKYKKLYENLLKQNEKLQKENEELKRKIENINDEVCILKEEDNLNKELIKENEDKVEELSNYIKQQNIINENRLDDFKCLLYKKDEEIQKLSKELEKIDMSKRNIYLSLNNEIENFKEKINKQNEEICKYKQKIELFQNENIVLKNINEKNEIYNKAKNVDNIDNINNRKE